MMDPFALIGVVASVAGLAEMGAKLCVTLNCMARVFVSAPESISLMNRDVSSLVSVLEHLQTALKDGNSHGLDLSREACTDLQITLGNCTLVLESVRRILSKFEQDPKELEGAPKRVVKIFAIKLRFRWMMGESEVVRIRRSLDTHVQTLQLTLTAITA
jgi:DNA repair ATPase RecN